MINQQSDYALKDRQTFLFPLQWNEMVNAILSQLNKLNTLS